MKKWLLKLMEGKHYDAMPRYSRKKTYVEGTCIFCGSCCGQCGGPCLPEQYPSRDPENPWRV